jgi:hypothetical protein
MKRDGRERFLRLFTRQPRFLSVVRTSRRRFLCRRGVRSCQLPKQSRLLQLAFVLRRPSSQGQGNNYRSTLGSLGQS